MVRSRWTGRLGHQAPKALTLPLFGLFSSRPLACSIAVELDGQIYVGTFTVDGTRLTVSYQAEARSVDLGDSAANPDILARRILGELVGETRRVEG